MSKRLVAALVVLVLVVAGLGAAIFSFTRTQSASPSNSNSGSPAATSSVKPTQVVPNNLLVAVTDNKKAIAVASVQGVTGAQFPLSNLSVPAGLAVDLDSHGRVVELASYSAPDITTASEQVSNQLGVSVGYSWGLERLAFAALVDSVGGVKLGRSSKTLTGLAAASYVLPEKGSLTDAQVNARFIRVWDAVLLKLPPEPTRLMSILTSLGATSQISTSVSAFADQLALIQTVARTNGVRHGQLATRSSGQGSLASISIDPGEAEPALVSLFPRTQIFPQRDGTLPRVRFVLVGANAQSAVDAQTRIAGANSSFVWNGSLPAKTKILNQPQIFVAPGAVGTQVGQELAQAFGVPATKVKVDPQRTIGVQALVMAS